KIGELSGVDRDALQFGFEVLVKDTEWEPVVLELEYIPRVQRCSKCTYEFRAEHLRERYRQLGVLCINLISAPGSGKTALLERTLQRMDKDSRVAVLTGDLQTANAARRLAKFGFPVKQITTGGTCHLDARMIGKHLEGWKLEDLDLLIVENVGNLVCPSSYDLGE